FFSSRRRHTRLQGDWSSDVCSSDLSVVGGANMIRQAHCQHSEHDRPQPKALHGIPLCDFRLIPVASFYPGARKLPWNIGQRPRRKFLAPPAGSDPYGVPRGLSAWRTAAFKLIAFQIIWSSFGSDFFRIASLAMTEEARAS